MHLTYPTSRLNTPLYVAVISDPSNSGFTATLFRSDGAVSEQDARQFQRLVVSFRGRELLRGTRGGSSSLSLSTWLGCC